MFNNYKIIEKDSEKVLILYIDSFYEFGIDFKNHNKNSSMKKEIKKIIKRINFTGEKVALMIGGIVLATVLVVENPKSTSDLDLIYVRDNIIPKIVTIDSNKKEKVDVLESVTYEEKVEEKNVNINEKNNDIVKHENTNVVKQDDIVVSKSNVINHIEETKEVIEKEENSKQIVTIYRSNGEVVNIELEEYLIGVVGSEMPASFNIEALKVQAIISRTYALKSIEVGRKLTDDVKTQSYKDNEELKKQWGSSYTKYYNKVKEAVDSTRGLAIFYNNQYIDAVFHSTSNGKTEDASYVWKNSVPYLKSVDSPWDISSSSYLRDTFKELNSVLNVLGVTDSDFSIASHDESGRVLEIVFGGKSFSGVEFRNLLGLRSADFDIEISDGVVKFITRGYGHGVGLSQYGANGMANAGYNYLSIIKHYYVGVEIK